MPEEGAAPVVDAQPMAAPAAIAAPPGVIPQPVLAFGVTGHRLGHAAMAGHQDDVAKALSELLQRVDALLPHAADWLAHAHVAPPRARLVSMLGDGVDRLTSDAALKRGWESVVALPFGSALTWALGAPAPADAKGADALMRQLSDAKTPPTDKDAQAFAALLAQSKVFALAERDDVIEAVWRRSIADKTANADAFNSATSVRYALAARMVVSQSDLLIAVWDGVSRTNMGGTGHTIATALECEIPVLWMRPDDPGKWRLLQAPEELEKLNAAPICNDRALTELLRKALAAPIAKEQSLEGLVKFAHESNRLASNPLWGAYRVIEWIFGDAKDPLDKTKKLKRTRLRTLHGEIDEALTKQWGDDLTHIRSVWRDGGAFADRIERELGRRFALADSVATNLSDAFRGAMTTNFALAVVAVLIGLFYLPVTTVEHKWMFVGAELTIVGLIVGVTYWGRWREWHERWLNIRRVAEYLRHERVFASIGVARPAGRWPQSTRSSWPEWLARQALRQVALPEGALGRKQLLDLGSKIILPYVDAQRDYHLQKAARLHAVHKNLDHLSLGFFVVATIVAGTYLGLHFFLPHDLLTDKQEETLSKWFTFLGVALPMSAATLSAIRYFGDFERFAGISDAAYGSLSNVSKRLTEVLSRPNDIDFESVSRLAQAAEEVVLEELRSWQSIFGGKDMSVPV